MFFGLKPPLTSSLFLSYTIVKSATSISQVNAMGLGPILNHPVLTIQLQMPLSFHFTGCLLRIPCSWIITIPNIKYIQGRMIP